jgi:hypothetical protein
MTMLPVDYNKRPWREKYLIEETPELNFWFIFGESKDGKTVDISDGDKEIFTNVPREIAEEIIEYRWHMCDIITKYFSNFKEKEDEMR